MTKDKQYRRPEESNHELGGTLGMTVGGVAGGIAAGAAAGAAIGGAAGPVGAVAGAAIGGALGGSAGESIAREINPTVEEQYWEENYRTRPYIQGDAEFDTYRPAYRYGVDAYSKYPNRSFDEIEPELGRSWESARGTSNLDWQGARDASRDAYSRLNTRTTDKL